MEAVYLNVNNRMYEGIVRSEDIMDEKEQDCVSLCGEDPAYVHRAQLHYRAVPCALFGSGWGYIDPFIADGKELLKPCSDPVVADVDGRRCYVY